MDNEVLINTKIDVDYARAEKDLIAIQKKIDALTKKRTVQVELKVEAAKQAGEIRAQLEAEKAKLEAMRGDLTQARNVAGQEQVVADLQKQYDSLIRQVEKYGDAITKSNVELKVMDDEAKKTAGILSDKGPTQTQQENVRLISESQRAVHNMGEETKKVSKHVSEFGARLKNLVKATLVFNVISRALQHIRDWFSKVIEANEETAKAMANFKGSLMTLIQPLVNVLLPIIERALAALTRIVSFISTIMATLFGTTLSASAAAAEELNDSVNGTASGLGSANAEAKKLKRTLAGFDEIEILSQSDTSGGGGGASATGAAFDFAGLDFGDFFSSEEFEKIREVGEKIQEIFGNIWGVIKEIVDLVIEWGKDVDFVPVLDSVLGLLDSIWAILQPMFETFKTVWNKLIGPILKKFIEKYLPRIIDSFSEMNEALGKVNEIMQPIVETLAEVLEPVIDIILEIITKIIEIINGSGAGALELIGRILQVIAPLLEAIFRILGPIIEAVLTIIEVVLELVDVFNDSLMFVLKLIIDLITGDMDAAKEDFNEYMGEMGEHLNKFKELFEKLAQTAQKIWEAIKNAAVGAWNGIKSVWNTVVGFFQGIINSVVNAWNTAINSIKQFFSNLWWSIKSGVVTAMNAVIGALESAINWLVDGLNGIISGINWVVGKAGKLFGADWSIGYVDHVYLGRIPLLAQGAVIPPNNPFLATLGDNPTETEIVSPLSTMKQALLEAMAEANFNGNINVYLDGKQISDSVTKYQLRANRALGV